MEGDITYIQGELDKNDDGQYESYINSLHLPASKINTYIQYRHKDLFEAPLSEVFHGSRKLFSLNEQNRYKTDESPISPITLIDLFASHSHKFN